MKSGFEAAFPPSSLPGPGAGGGGVEGRERAQVPGHQPGALDREAGVGVQRRETAEREGPLPAVASLRSCCLIGQRWSCISTATVWT